MKDFQKLTLSVCLDRFNFAYLVQEPTLSKLTINMAMKTF